MSDTQEKLHRALMTGPNRWAEATINGKLVSYYEVHDVDILLALIESAKREELELYVKYIEGTDKFYPLYADLDKDTAVNDCRRFAANYGKHRLAQLRDKQNDR